MIGVDDVVRHRLRQLRSFPSRRNQQCMVRWAAVCEICIQQTGGAGDRAIGRAQHLSDCSSVFVLWQLAFSSAPILSFPRDGGRNDNAPTFQSIRIVGTAVTLRFDSAYMFLPRFGGGLRWGLATNVSRSFTLSTAPSASARCSPGRAPPLG